MFHARGPLAFFISGLCVVLTLMTPLALCKQPERIAVGFNLGQSYGTSVARFENGTTLNLAKVGASPQYAALMERLIRKPFPPFWLNRHSTIHYWLSIWRLLQRSLGFPPTHTSAVLAELLSALKSESEIALQTRIGTVAVTAPWMASWDEQLPFDSVVNDALVLAGLEPIDWMANDPIYLGETNTILAANERHICKKAWCTHGFAKDDEDSAFVYLISFTNRSLHTSFQSAECFYYNSRDNRVAYIDAEYGLDQAGRATTEADFWRSLQDRLLYFVAKHSDYDYGYWVQLPMLVLVAGEAAETPAFLAVVKEVVKRIPDLRAELMPELMAQEMRKKPSAELMVSEDPTFAAAKGAAFWFRTRMDRRYSYCDDDMSQESEETLTEEGHAEL